MNGSFLQSFDADGDHIFIDLQEAVAYWILPSDTKFSQLTTLTHETQDGRFYYENLGTGAVTWSLVSDEITITKDAVTLASQLLGCSREEAEIIIDSPFPEKESEEQMVALQMYFEDSQIYLEEINNEELAEDNADAVMKELENVNIEEHSEIEGKCWTHNFSNCLLILLPELSADAIDNEDSHQSYEEELIPAPKVKTPAQIAEENGVNLSLYRDKQQKWVVRPIHVWESFVSV